MSVYNCIYATPTCRAYSIVTATLKTALQPSQCHWAELKVTFTGELWEWHQMLIIPYI